MAKVQRELSGSTRKNLQKGLSLLTEKFDDNTIYKAPFVNQWYKNLYDNVELFFKGDVHLIPEEIWNDTIIYLQFLSCLVSAITIRDNNITKPKELYKTQLGKIAKYLSCAEIELLEDRNAAKIGRKISYKDFEKYSDYLELMFSEKKYWEMYLLAEKQRI